MSWAPPVEFLMQLFMGQDEQWIRRMAELEDGCDVSAGTETLEELTELLKEKTESVNNEIQKGDDLGPQEEKDELRKADADKTGS